jgi:hypothetical protein
LFYFIVFHFFVFVYFREGSTEAGTDKKSEKTSVLQKAKTKLNAMGGKISKTFSKLKSKKPTEMKEMRKQVSFI